MVRARLLVQVTIVEFGLVEMTISTQLLKTNNDDACEVMFSYDVPSVK